MAMLQIAALAAQALLVALIAYNLITAIPGWRNPPPPPVAKRRIKLRVVVPAHNEEAVIGRLLDDLGQQDYSPQQVSIWVLADRCTDGTAEVARSKAAVAERLDGADGKGAALAWYLEQNPLDPDETLIIIDADNRVPAGLLSRIADEIDAGASAVQVYLDTANPDSSRTATAAALSYWASNRMVQLARHNLGWPVDLGGTGMALTAGALDAVGGFGSSLTEDQELGARLALAGHAVRWVHDVRIHDEKPRSVGVAVRQRSRWATGRSKVARTYLGELIRSRQPGTTDLAFRLVQPGRTFLALVTAVLFVVAVAWPGEYLLSWPLWLTLALIQLLAPLPFLVRDGVESRYLAKYPLVTIIGLLYLPARIVARFGRGWYHTPHEGD
jgi:cellulose synthase/poly-beta-1,6-N-acetylglucosamine synthase-like glycosyltransferase